MSVMTSVMGAVLLFMGLSDVMGWWIDLEGWGFWSGGVGVLIFIVGIIWMVSIVQRIRKFHILMAERSRAVFVRKLDEIEYTAWRLSSKYDRLVSEKKVEMGVK